jgi:hypothetical protein
MADGWLPIMFIPEKFHHVWGDQLKAGLAKRDPSLPRLDIAAGGMLAIGEDLVGDKQAEILDFARPTTALYVGGMGARGKNFYNDICRDYGYEQEAVDIQDLYLDGKKDEAAARVPGEWLELSHLVGPVGYIKDRGRRLQRGRRDRVVGQPGRPRRRQADRDLASDRRRRLTSGTVTAMANTTVGGFVAPGWEPVRAAFEKNFELGEEVGASAAVYHRGQRVVDIWGGGVQSGKRATVRRHHPSTDVQHDEGDRRHRRRDVRATRPPRLRRTGVDVLARVRAHDKGEATVAQLLSHQCGLIAPDGPVTLADALDWKTITAMLADTKPIGRSAPVTAITRSPSASLPAS